METRVDKHKQYRSDLIKAGVATVNKSASPRTNTGTLPLNIVMEPTEDEGTKEFYKTQYRQKIIIMILLGLVIIALVVGLVLFGIYAFGGK